MFGKFDKTSCNVVLAEGIYLCIQHIEKLIKICLIQSVRLPSCIMGWMNVGAENNTFDVRKLLLSIWDNI